MRPIVLFLLPSLLSSDIDLGSASLTKQCEQRAEIGLEVSHPPNDKQSLVSEAKSQRRALLSIPAARRTANPARRDLFFSKIYMLL